MYGGKKVAIIILACILIVTVYMCISKSKTKKEEKNNSHVNIILDMGDQNMFHEEYMYNESLN